MKRFLAKLIYRLLPIKKRIVFESNPEFSCNSFPVYKEMVKRGIRSRFEIYWLVENKERYKNDTSGDKYLNYEEHGLGIIKKKYILATSKGLIFTNRFLVKHKKKQLVVNLMHGSPMKRAPGYYEGDTCDYVISASEYFCEALNECLGVPLEKIITLGYPRNDVLDGEYNVKLKLQIENDCKLIVWMPTFRKNKNSGFQYGSVTSLGVPLINTEDSFREINKYLHDRKIKLLIKLHPVEDLCGLELKSYSNIMFLSDQELKKKELTAYQVLAESDALLTDYSSVYFDYLMLDKPIGLITDNLQEFTQEIGFYCGDYKSNIKGKYIESIAEFEEFIDEIHKGIDSTKQERAWAIDRYCDFLDFKSTERVTDFILERLD